MHPIYSLRTISIDIIIEIIMREILDNIYLLEGVRGCNVYLLDSGNELTLIDSGLQGQGDKIETQFQESGFSLSQLRYIILTHAHRDHMGSANEVATPAVAKVLAHEGEIPYLEKRETLPLSSLLGMFLTWLEKKFLPKVPPCLVDKGLNDGERLDILGGLQVILTPGHTPGNISLYHPERKILFCGDTLFNQNPATGKKGLRLPIFLFTADKKDALESVNRLSTFPIQSIFFGHGDPILENGNERIQSLIEKKSG